MATLGDVLQDALKERDRKYGLDYTDSTGRVWRISPGFFLFWSAVPVGVSGKRVAEEMVIAMSADMVKALIEKDIVVAKEKAAAAETVVPVPVAGPADGDS